MNPQSTKTWTSETRLSDDRIIDALGDGVALVDRDACIVRWSPAMTRCFGYRQDAVIGRALDTCFSRQPAQKLLACVKRVLQHGDPEDIELGVVPPDESSQHTYRVQVCAVGDDGQEVSAGDVVPTMAVLLFSDISKHVELERQLRQTDRLASIGRLSASVARELNDPLDGTIRYLGLAVDQVTEQGLAREYLSLAREGLHSIAKVVRALLEFSRRSRSGDERLVDVNEAVEGALLLLGYEHTYPGVELQTDLLSAAPLVKDYGLEQVLLNVLKNAFESMPEGGVLGIEARLRHGQVCLTIQDTGHGIAPEHMGRLFEPFFSTKNIGQGTGLGLAVSKQIVDRAGGELIVESVPGDGTTVQVYWPVPAESAETGQKYI